MWMIAGLLVGFVVLVSAIGFHLGSHVHAAAGALGVLTAAWLVFMLVDGQSAPVLWTLLTADVVVSVGVGVLAWKGLSTSGTVVEGRHLISPVAADGIALNDLSPSGIVRVNGENWSAVAANGTVRSGTPVQVLRVDGIRLEVWGEKTVSEDLGDVELEAEASRPAAGPRQDRSPWTLSEVEDEGQLP
jgi:membrane-bound ClpP family serine protease